MGIKGDKLSNLSNIQAQELVAKLNSLGNISSKKMFGGNGVFIDGKMFAMVNSKGECFLKVDENLASIFAISGSKKHTKMPYSSIPDEIMNNQVLLLDWAKKSVELVK